jgi:hypothetical protein
VRHFHRTTLAPDEVLVSADQFFPALGLSAVTADGRVRRFSGTLGSLRLSVKMEGGHYTFVEVHSDQVGESRLDKNVKKFFVALHRRADPRHRIEAGY